MSLLWRSYIVHSLTLEVRGQGSGATGWLDVPLRVRSCDCAISARALCIFSRSKSPLYTTSSSRAAASWFSSSSCLRLAAWYKEGNMAGDQQCFSCTEMLCFKIFSCYLNTRRYSQLYSKDD